MSAIYNDVFRMVNLRGRGTEVSVEPDPGGSDGNGNGNGPIVEMIRSGALELGAATAPQFEELFRRHRDLIELASSSGLRRLTDALIKEPALAPETEVAWDDTELPLSQVAHSTSFKRDYTAVLNAWLLLKYGGRRDLETFANQLRVGEWLRSLAKNAAGAEPLPALLRKPVSIPRSLRAAVTKKRLKKRPAWKPAKKTDVPTAGAAYDGEEREIAKVNAIIERIGDAVLVR